MTADITRAIGVNIAKSHYMNSSGKLRSNSEVILRVVNDVNARQRHDSLKKIIVVTREEVLLLKCL